MKLHQPGFEHAAQLIASGQVDRAAPWSLSATEEDALLGDPPDWAAYGRWHLGRREDASEETKAGWAYPFGKAGKVYRSALTAVRQRAGQQGQQDIFEAAGRLLERIEAEAASQKAQAVEVVCQDGSTAPQWIQLVPAGPVRSSKGDFLADEQAMAETVAAFEALGRDLVIDYEHQTLSGEEAPAAGWIQALEVRPDGLWARVRWTERGQGYVARREYRYLSPVVMVRRSDNRMVAIHSVALTNDPAIVGMRPIANKNKGSHEEATMKGVLECLGLKADATEEAIIAALKGLQAKVQDFEEFRRGLVEILGLGEAATAAEARGAILALKNPSGFVSVAEFRALKERLDRREAEDLVEAAMKAGKVTPANREWALTYALKDRAGFQAFVEHAPVVVPTGTMAAAGQAGGGPGGLTDVEALVCRSLGLTADQWKKHNSEEV